jgi:hypothetical protein
MNLDELVAHLEVEINKLDEKINERNRYEQGVRAMALARNVEGN